ncbi:hypothetical protein A4A49_65186 [Nicotiana attenuata]|uniref:Uncharacterized protein n=1 Tax=Nicotiana attenuata TaxID=49451 RepID=A0A1J6IUL6_NICAT|nr:hypothetical protein A4A49_65186 [Nicotiana attenuata]
MMLFLSSLFSLYLGEFWWRGWRLAAAGGDGVRVAAGFGGEEGDRAAADGGRLCMEVVEFRRDGRRWTAGDGEDDWRLDGFVRWSCRVYLVCADGARRRWQRWRKVG